MPSLAFAITPEAGPRDTSKHGSSSKLVSKIRFNRVHTTQVLQPFHSPRSLVGQFAHALHGQLLLYPE